MPSRTPGNARGPLWTGPPNLSAAEKKSWREAQRRAHLHQDPTWLFKETARSAKRTDKRTGRPIGRQLAAAFRDAGIHHIQHGTGLAPLTYIDRHGALHREDRRTAEQLIHDFVETASPPDAKASEKGVPRKGEKA